MRAKHQCCVLVGLLAFVSALAAVAKPEDRNEGVAPPSHFPSLHATTQPAKDRTLDTAITWERTIQAAADKARREGKLVFVIHVSGDFEQQEFT
jgi:hypothetical protein